MILCHFCQEREKTQVKGGFYCCDICNPPPFFNFGIVETVNLPDYGQVPKKRIDELKRRVILPYERADGGYYVGRRGENGKVQEREPDYSR